MVFVLYKSMSPAIATFAFICLIILLLYLERKNGAEVSLAVWIPFFWMLFSSSRYLSQWMSLGAPNQLSMDAYLEGSTPDRIAFLGLEIAGWLVLIRRRLDWAALIRKNIWIWLFFLYGLLSVLWSDYPLVSFKRLIKASGNVIMALVILTERHPAEAFGLTLKRLAFILLPLSVLFIKYYPEIGRAYHFGMQMSIGVTTHKNSLGQLCLILGIYFAWNLLHNRQQLREQGNRRNTVIHILVLGLLAWLLYRANSATSLACLVLALGVLFISRIPAVRKRPAVILSVGLTMLVVFLLLEATLGLSTLLIGLLGRDPSLTTRVPMWYELIRMAENPLFGVGYETFWLGSRLYVLWAAYGALIQAHNGYLEVYLNLGLIGLALILLSMLKGFSFLWKQSYQDYSFTILKLTYLIVILVYNWTEATFYGVNILWLLMYVGIFNLAGQTERVLTEKKAGSRRLDSLLSR